MKDSRTDWDITEGTAKITSEQALEASGDPEYEARRQIAKAHNEVLYREGQAHRERGSRMVKVGIIAAAAGLVFGAIVPAALRTTDSTTAPGMQTTSATTASKLATAIAYIAVLGGLGYASYGYTGGKKSPPYYFWHTPKALERPAYLREHVEDYNERSSIRSSRSTRRSNPSTAVTMTGLPTARRVGTARRARADRTRPIRAATVATVAKGARASAVGAAAGSPRMSPWSRRGSPIACSR